MMIICGPGGRVTAESISHQDKKTVRNFAKFLRGEGTRCPHCLHKAKKHWVGAEGNTCWGSQDDCDCVASRGWVERWWAKRIEGKR